MKTERTIILLAYRPSVRLSVTLNGPVNKKPSCR